MDICQWPERCREQATHTVVVHFPGEPEEAWRVCRQHERQLKTQAVRNRPPRPPRAEATVPNVVRCSGCGRVIDEPSDIADELRSRCPDCGSTTRTIEVQLAVNLDIHMSIRARTKTPGRGGWMLDTRSGDNYTRDLEAWGTRGMTTDRKHDLYREVIELWDGTRIESTGRLSDHQD